MSRWHKSSGYGPAFSGLPPIGETSRVVSGFCKEGSHEGRPKKLSNGERMKECVYPQHCNCDCHKQEKMLRDKIPSMTTPEFRTPGAPIPLLLGVVTDISGALLSSGTTIIEDTEKEVENTTLHNRTEWKVYSVCKTFEELGAHESGLMTISFLQERTELVGVSPGAIDAVLKRWALNGFATMEKKPTRFTGFSTIGKQLGLEEFLRRQKRSK